MADHGTNRRRSHYARLKHKKRVAKEAKARKEIRAKLDYWYNHWHKIIEENK